MSIAVTKTNRMKKEIDNECKFVLYTLPSITTEKQLLRAYFIALTELQIGKICIDKPFRLWKSNPNLKTHINNKRLEHLQNGLYKLTASGIRYFNNPKQQPLPDYYNSFIKALCTGNKEDLPPDLKDKRLKPF